jgi:hypothetical protein
MLIIKNDLSKITNEETVLNHSLSDAQFFDTPIYDKYYDSDEDQAVDMNPESREHLETKHSECQDSKSFYDQPIFDEYLDDDDEHEFFHGFFGTS